MKARDAHCLEEELRYQFPRRKFRVIVSKNGKLLIRYSRKPIDLARLKRIASRWHWAAYGSGIKWGEVFKSKGRI